jgi:hypothetical protein
VRYGDYPHYYQLDDLPGCSQVAVSHSMFLHPNCRGQGYSYTAGFDRIRKMKELGYDYAICTVDSSNVAEIKQLNNSGWFSIGIFDSKKTGHVVRIYGKSLNTE